MNCGCPECGTLTVQAARGLHSRCVCPACGWTCSACMGDENDPGRALTREEILRMKEAEDKNSSIKP